MRMRMASQAARGNDESAHRGFDGGRERLGDAGELREEAHEGRDVRRVAEQVQDEREGARALPLRVEPCIEWHGEKLIRGDRKSVV